MIRGYFTTRGARRRPAVDAVLRIPALSDRSFEVQLLVDTGADRPIIAPLDANRLQREFRVDLTTLPRGLPSTGVGGQTETRTGAAVLTLDTFSTSLPVTFLDPLSRLPIPSLLGRDILSRFALYVEERSDLVLLLEPAEADNLRVHLPL